VKEAGRVAVALVTGASTGIGRAFCEQLARKGLDLVLVARDEQRLAVVAAELRDRYGVDCDIVRADLSVRSDVDDVARIFAERRIDVLVNNAGFGLNRGFTRTSVDDEQRLLDVLVTAVLRLTHAAVPPMVERGFGVVINVGSLAAWLPGGTYSAAKSWVTVFSQSLAESLRGSGVRVVVAAAGFTRTELHSRAAIDMSALPGWLWLDADRVAATALRDAAIGRSVSVAGRQYRPISWALRHGAPRLLLRVAAVRDRARGLGARR
jgi:short-subunit dehydrogenase